MRRRRALALFATTLASGCAGLNPAREPPPRGTVVGTEDAATATSQPTTTAGAAFEVTEWSPTSADGALALSLSVTNGGREAATAQLSVRVTLAEGATATASRTDTDGSRYVVVTREVQLAAGGTTTLTVETGVPDDAWTGISFEWRPA